jgi:hypothetical protein
MTQVLRYSKANAKRRRRSLAAAATAEPTEAEIKKAQWRKHIAEISKHLAIEPIQSQELTFEQQEWLEFRMARPFPKPYRPHTPIEIPYKWIDKMRTAT